MKILIVASNMVHIKNFHLPYVSAFRDAGHEVSVMASGEGADFNIPFKKRAFSFKNLRLSFLIKRILKKERFDAIFLHTTLAAFWVRFALKGIKSRPTVVNTVHGYLFSEHSSALKRKIYLMAERIVRKKTDYIAVMNKDDLAIARDNKLALNEPFLIDGMGVNLSRTENAKRHAFDGKLRLVYVGEISKRKNQIFLVKSLLKLDNAILTLVGDGDERETIEKFAKENGISDRVIITGFTKNVKEHLESADIYVSASTIEGLPFNIMEAMSAKMPIVASDIKGQRDLLTSDQLYSLNNEEEFVALVRKTALGEREYDLEKYKIDNALPKNVSIYLDKIRKL